MTLINLVTKNDLIECINNVRNAGDKARSYSNYSEASVMVLFTNNYSNKDSSIIIIKPHEDKLTFIICILIELSILFSFVPATCIACN